MKFKLKHKILLIFISGGLCVLLIVGSLLSINLKEWYLTATYHGLQGQLTDINFAITQFFKSFERDLEGLAANPAVRSRKDADFTSFVEADEASFEYRIGSLEQEIIQIFRRYQDSHENVNSVYMGRENGSFIRARKRNRTTRYDPRLRPWYRLAKENPGKIVRTAPYASVTSPDVNIGIVRALVDTDQNVYGVVGIDVTLESLTRFIEKIRVGRNGYLLLVDAEGTILAARDRSMLFQDIEEICKGDLDELFARKEGSVIFTRNGRQYYLVFSRSVTLDWPIGFALPKEDVTREVYKVVVEVVLVLAGTLCLLSVISLIGLEDLVVKPLKKLYTGTEFIAKTGDLDHRIHIPSNDEIGSLADSFNRMGRDLKVHIQQLTEMTALKERIESELRIARDIQMDLLPATFPPFPDRSELDIYASIAPAEQVGGDLYNFFFLDDDHLFFVIGDVAGHGVPAALFMARTMALIASTAKWTEGTAAILQRVNEELSSNNDAVMFVTVFCGILSIPTGNLVYTVAGQNPPLWVRRDGSIQFLDPTGDAPLGLEADLHFHEAFLSLQPGDILFLYTDGITEAFNEENEMFGADRLADAVSLHAGDSIKDLVRIIGKTVDSFSGEVPQADDIAMLALRYVHDDGRGK